jgi:hypothetical protein
MLGRKKKFLVGVLKRKEKQRRCNNKIETEMSYTRGRRKKKRVRSKGKERCSHGGEGKQGKRDQLFSCQPTVKNN